MRRLIPVLFGSAALLSSASLAAQPSPSTPLTMGAAQGELAAGEKALAAAGTDCVIMCKALQSMARAADRICEIAQTGTDVDKKRCTDARARLEEATTRVRAACPGCVAHPPAGEPPPNVTATKPGVADLPSETPPQPTTTPTKEPTADVDGKKVELDKGEAAGRGPVFAESKLVSAPGARGSQSHPWLTVGIAPVRLFLPAYMVRVSAEVRVLDVLSASLFGGYGSMPARSASGSERASTLLFGGQLRTYVVGGFGGGFFVGIDATYARASYSSSTSRLDTHAVTPGLTLGPIAGMKLVAGRGFTLDTHLGIGIVTLDDRRGDGARDAVVPLWDVTIGWSF